MKMQKWFEKILLVCGNDGLDAGLCCHSLASLLAHCTKAKVHVVSSCSSSVPVYTCRIVWTCLSSVLYPSFHSSFRCSFLNALAFVRCSFVESKLIVCLSLILSMVWCYCQLRVSCLGRSDEKNDLNEHDRKGFSQVILFSCVLSDKSTFTPETVSIVKLFSFREGRDGIIRGL